MANASFVHRNGPVTLVSMTRFHASDGNLVYAPAVERARVVYEDVDPAQGVHRLGKEVLDILFAGNVGGHGYDPRAVFGQFLCGLSEPLGIPGRDDHVAPFLRKYACDALADTGTAARDNRCFSF